jgi:hypothetical protein
MLSWLKSDKVDHPLANAKRARQIVDDFPYKNARQTLEDAHQWLTSVNETTEFKLDRRFELIDMLDVATRKSQAQLTDSFMSLGEDDLVQERRISKTLSDFWRALGDGYLACARQCTDAKSVPGAMRSKLAVIAARGLRALRLQIKWTMMRYGLVRGEIWEECARLTSLGESTGAATQAIELYEGGNAQSSPIDEFMRLMMFWSASPSGLSPQEQELADRLITYLTPKFRYSARQENGCDYFFVLSGTHPPLRLVSSSPITPANRYFDAGDARAALDQLQGNLVLTGVTPSSLDLGPAAEVNVVLRLIRHLMVNWATQLPARAHERRKTAMTLNVVHGYQGVQGAVAPGSAEGLDFSVALAHDTWVAEDVSVGGYGVIVPAGKGDWLRVGVLVAVRGETDTKWQVGIVRRVKAGQYTQHHIGIQLITRSPMPSYLRTLPGVAQGRTRQFALLLNERPSASGSMHVLARRDVFSGREPVEAQFGDPPVTIMLDAGGVVESGQYFDWLRYKVPSGMRRA